MPDDLPVHGDSPGPSGPLNLAEIEALGEGCLAPGTAAYYAGAAADEVTLADNLAAFRRWRFRPRVMVPIAERDASVVVLGRRWPAPVVVAPMALHRLAHPDGELAVARAAAARGLTMTLSTVASASIEEVAAVGGPRWFQLYLLRDRGRTQGLLDRAAASGYESILLTLDCPMVGRRERDLRTGFRLPPDVRYANIQHRPPEHGEDYGQDELLGSYSWADLDWVAAHSMLPVVTKGVLHPDDARLAVDHGAAAVVVSNHGGRQLDLSMASLDALPAVVRAVGGSQAVLVDGGIRRGTDVLMALALGARAVMLGRPLLMALALGGEAMVGRAFDLLLAEIDRALALSGVPRVSDLRPDLLVRVGTVPA